MNQPPASMAADARGAAIPDDLRLLLERVRSETRASRPEQADELLARAIELTDQIEDPGLRLDAMTALARTAAEIGQPGRAREFLEQVVRASEDPLRRDRALLELGRVSVTSGDPVRATEIFQQVAAETRDRGVRNDALLALSSAWASQGETRQALALAEQVVKEADSERQAAEAMTLLGTLLAWRLVPPDLGGALEWYRRAAELGSREAMAAMGVMLEQRLDPPDPQGAQEWYRRAAELGDPGAQKRLEEFSDAPVPSEVPVASEAPVESELPAPSEASDGSEGAAGSPDNLQGWAGEVVQAAGAAPDASVAPGVDGDPIAARPATKGEVPSEQVPPEVVPTEQASTEQAAPDHAAPDGVPSELGASADAVEAPKPRGPLLAGATADVVPQPGNHRVRDADFLGTAGEVEMLVSVLVARETPMPLAVGLFGDWGSGKSFFMAQMQERIDELAAAPKGQAGPAWPFCERVRQIRFNAWHYVDSDLWASLANTLFDQLAHADAPDEAQAKLAEIEKARTRVDSIAARRRELEREVAVLEAGIGRPEAVIGSAWGTAIRAVREDPKLVGNLRSLAGQLPAGVGAPPASQASLDAAKDLVDALGQVDSLGEQASVSWRLLREEVAHRRRQATLLWLVVLVAVAVGAWFLLDLTGVQRLLTLLLAACAALAPALSATRRILDLAREARERRELPLVEKRRDLVKVAEAETEARQEVADRQEELASIQDRGARLRDFVRERAASTVYRERLGTISQVRKDFEQLLAFIPGTVPAEGPGEGRAAGAASGSAASGAGAAAVPPEIAVAAGVPDVERIVLYIDDLDRCPQDKVVDVLQAVHLLLAFPLFVVVVGVDSRWLTRSLHSRYQHLLEDPADYLEKIFQIPFVLERMSKRNHAELMQRLTLTMPGRAGGVGESGEGGDSRVGTGGVGAGASGEGPDAVGSEDVSIGAPGSWRGVAGADVGGPGGDVAAVGPSGPAEAGTDADGVRPVEELRSGAKSGALTPTPTLVPGSTPGATASATPGSDAGPASTSAPEVPTVTARPEALVLSELEREYLAGVAKILPTPRSAKRFVNIYRMLRVSVPPSELTAFEPGTGDEYQAAALLLGVLVGRPRDAGEVFGAIVAAGPDDDIWTLLDGYPEVAAALSEVRVGTVVTRAEVYQAWVHRVSRFSFRLMGPAGLPVVE